MTMKPGHFFFRYLVIWYIYSFDRGKQNKSLSKGYKKKDKRKYGEERKRGKGRF